MENLLGSQGACSLSDADPSHTQSKHVRELSWLWLPEASERDGVTHFEDPGQG